MEKKNIIFLDIDGVLQPGSAQKRFDHSLDELMLSMGEKYGPSFTELSLDKYDVGAVYYDWYNPAVENLRNLITQGDSSIVISSAWREGRTMEQLKALFHLHELGQYIIGMTAILRGEGTHRGVEIKDYIDTHDDIKNFVILDDVSWGIVDIFPEQFVHCREGYLKEKENEKALKILRGEST